MFNIAAITHSTLLLEQVYVRLTRGTPPTTSAGSTSRRSTAMCCSRCQNSKARKRCWRHCGDSLWLCTSIDPNPNQYKVNELVTSTGKEESLLSLANRLQHKMSLSSWHR